MSFMEENHLSKSFIDHISLWILNLDGLFIFHFSFISVFFLSFFPAFFKYAETQAPQDAKSILMVSVTSDKVRFHLLLMF